MNDVTMIRGRVVAPAGVIDDGVVAVEDGVIQYVEPTPQAGPARPVAESSGPLWTILPGLVDMHCHGGGGLVLTTADPDEARAVVRHHREAGTTTLVASLVTASPDVLLDQVRALAPLVLAGELAGLHLEGPFLSRARCGAQDPEHLLDPDLGLVARLLDAATGTIKVMTLAPELPGAAEVAAMLRSAGVVVALGHSDATYDVFRSRLQALDGHGLVTHLANGMPPLHHRAAGPVGAALVEAAAGRATVELIADGVHVDDGFARLVFATAGAGAVALVTDAMAAAGMPDGDYALGEQRVRVRGRVARLAIDAANPAGSVEGASVEPAASIAGGTSHLVEVLARVVTRSGVALPDAAAAATSTPARLAGVSDRAGSLAAGRPADLVLVDEHFSLQRVMYRGEWLGR